MKLVQLFLEYNVFNVDDITKTVKRLSHHISDSAVVGKLVKVIRREAINNLDWLQPLKQVPSQAPDWAQSAAAQGDLYQFVLNPTLRSTIEHITHYLSAAIDDRDKPLSPSTPDFTFLNQRKLDSTSTLANLEKMSFSALAKKSQDYFNALSSRAVKDDAGTHTVLDTGTGLRWVELDTQEAFAREGKVLQNCIGSHWTLARTKSQGQKILVLKDSTNASHVAARLDGTEIQEIKGKQNMPPVAKYMPATNALIKHLNLIPSWGSLRDFGGSGYLWDEKTKNLEHVFVLYPPDIVAQLSKDITLTKSNIPAKASQYLNDRYASPMRIDGGTQYQIVKNNQLLVSLLVAGRTLAHCTLSEQEADVQLLTQLLAKTFEILNIDNVDDLANRVFLRRGIYWQDNKFVSREDYFRGQQVASAPAGVWTRFMMNDSMRDEINRLDPSINYYGDFTVYKLENADKNTLLLAFSHHKKTEIIRVKGNTDKQFMTENLVPLLKEQNLRLSPHLPFVLSDKDTIEDFDDVFRVSPVVKVELETGNCMWYKVPNEAVKQGYEFKFTLKSELRQSDNIYLCLPQSEGTIPDHQQVREKTKFSAAISNSNQLSYFSFDKMYGIYDSPQARQSDNKQRLVALRTLLNSLGVSSAKPEEGAPLWMMQSMIWPPSEPMPISVPRYMRKYGTEIDLGDNFKALKVPSEFNYFLNRYFSKLYKSAQTYYLIYLPGNAENYGKINGSSGFIAVGKNNRVVGVSENNKDSMRDIASNAQRVEKLLGVSSAAGKEAAPLKPLKVRGKVIKPESRLHKVLRGIKNWPGLSRRAAASAYGNTSDQLPSITSDAGIDGWLNNRGMISLRDPGRNPNTYQLRITPKGQELLDRLEAGETVPQSDYPLPPQPNP